MSDETYRYLVKPDPNHGETLEILRGIPYLDILDKRDDGILIRTYHEVAEVVEVSFADIHEGVVLEEDDVSGDDAHDRLLRFDEETGFYHPVDEEDVLQEAGVDVRVVEDLIKLHRGEKVTYRTRSAYGSEGKLILSHNDDSEGRYYLRIRAGGLRAMTTFYEVEKAGEHTYFLVTATDDVAQTFDDPDVANGYFGTLLDLLSDHTGD